MYKTEANLQKTVREVITVEMNSEMDNVNIYVTDAVGSLIVNEAAIDLSPEGFIDLVYPILKAKGCTLSPAPEGF